MMLISVSPPALIPSIITQKANKYNGNEIMTCKTTTVHSGIPQYLPPALFLPLSVTNSTSLSCLWTFSGRFFVGGGDETIGEAGVCCLVGGGVNKGPSISLSFSSSEIPFWSSSSGFVQ